MELFEIEDFDYYLFLISGDWCSQLMSIHIGLSPTQMALAQQASRSAIKHIMSTCANTSPDYLLTDMSRNRKKKTLEVFEKQLSNEEIICKIRNFILGQKVYTHEETIVVNVFLMLLEDCTNADKCMLKLNFLEGDKDKFYNQIKLWTENDYKDSDEVLLQSTSDWDKYLVSLFSETPTALSDFYDLKIAKINSFETLWGIITSDFVKDRKHKFILAISDAYEEMTGNKCIVPEWI